MGSGLIYAVIVLVWAAVLIPMWLRHHDEVSETRSADRFSRAMHTLSRRDSVEAPREHRYVVMPRRPVGSTGVVRSDGPTAEAPRMRSSAPARSSAPTPGRRPVSIAVRRRRVLSALLLTTLVLGLASPLTPVPWWIATVSLLLAVGYVVHLRVQARRRFDLRRRRASMSRMASARLARLDSADRVFAVRSDRLSAQLAEVRAAAAEATRAAADAVTTRVADRTAILPAVGDGWEPVPVPLPTYVTKPKAVRPARSLDLSSAGIWSSARGAEASESVYDDRAVDLTSPLAEPVATAGPVADVTDSTVDLTHDGDELDAILDRRWAVND